MISLNHTIDGFKKTDYFSSDFLTNYFQIGLQLDSIIKNANPKYNGNEMNFGFEGADNWNGFQDEADDYWNKLLISDFKLTTKKASLKWWINTDIGLSSSNKYLVGFVKNNGLWKVSYLYGFDKINYK